jgi:hypothetical protein
MGGRESTAGNTEGLADHAAFGATVVGELLSVIEA